MSYEDELHNDRVMSRKRKRNMSPEEKIQHGLQKLDELWGDPRLRAAKRLGIISQMIRHNVPTGNQCNQFVDDIMAAMEKYNPDQGSFGDQASLTDRTCTMCRQVKSLQGECADKTCSGSRT